MRATDVDRVGPFPIYLPVAGSAALGHVLPASAIVGFPLEDNPARVHLFFEGNRYAIEGLRRFADRANFAAGRCRWFRFDARYWAQVRPNEPVPHVEYGFASFPTRAQITVEATAVTLVALYDEVVGIVEPLGPEERVLLTDWIGSADPLELHASGLAFQQRRQERANTEGGGPM